MFYDIEQAIKACNEDPSLIFEAIKNDYLEVIEKVIINDNFDFNTLDSDGNNVIMRLLKTKKYDLVNNYLDKIDINHQNNDGDTLMHILVTINYVEIKELLEKVLNIKELDLNIKNNKGETILDKSINEKYIYTASKILADERFTLVNLASFKSLYDTYVKSSNYGVYSKISNFTLIVDNISLKELLPNMEKLIILIKKNIKLIEKDFLESKTDSVDKLLNYIIEETI